MKNILLRKNDQSYTYIYIYPYTFTFTFLFLKLSVYFLNKNNVALESTRVQDHFFYGFTQDKVPDHKIIKSIYHTVFYYSQMQLAFNYAVSWCL
jgi:hypothetical protein